MDGLDARNLTDIVNLIVVVRPYICFTDPSPTMAWLKVRRNDLSISTLCLTST